MSYIKRSPSYGKSLLGNTTYHGDETRAKIVFSVAASIVVLITAVVFFAVLLTLAGGQN